MLLQTIVLPQMRFFEFSLSFIPVCLVCIAVREGAERGTFFAILAGLVFCLSGISDGPLYLVLFSVSAALAGAVCDNFYTRSFVPALVLSLMALLFCETAVFLFRVNTTGTDAALWHTVLLPMIMVSLLAFPLFYLGAWAISRIAR